MAIEQGLIPFLSAGSLASALRLWETKYAGEPTFALTRFISELGDGAALLSYLLIARTIGIRSDTLHEQRGLDFTEHAEIGYPEFQQTQTFNPEGLYR